MLGDITAADEIYIVCGYTDMRRSIDGLCAIVQDRLRMDPTQAVDGAPHVRVAADNIDLIRD